MCFWGWVLVITLFGQGRRLAAQDGGTWCLQLPLCLPAAGADVLMCPVTAPALERLAGQAGSAASAEGPLEASVEKGGKKHKKDHTTATNAFPGEIQAPVRERPLCFPCSKPLLGTELSLPVGQQRHPPPISSFSTLQPQPQALADESGQPQS